MEFEVIGDVTQIETIAIGHGVRELQNLKRLFGDALWRKRKGTARIKLPNGNIRLAEIHWYEAHGIGRRKLKVKRFLD